MGKYRRYKNIIEMFLSSEKGKRVLNFCYSWGASVVIIGALFKLLHLPYANQILFVAMITEAYSSSQPSNVRTTNIIGKMSFRFLNRRIR